MYVSTNVHHIHVALQPAAVLGKGGARLYSSSFLRISHKRATRSCCSSWRNEPLFTSGASFLLYDLSNSSRASSSSEIWSCNANITRAFSLSKRRKMQKSLSDAKNAENPRYPGMHMSDRATNHRFQYLPIYFHGFSSISSCVSS